MTGNKEVRAIKNVVLSAVGRLDDIKGLYMKEQTGDMLSIYKVARGEEKQLEAIALQPVTKTRLAIGLQLKIDRKSNVPIIYRELMKILSEDLKTIRFNLAKLELSIIDVDTKEIKE